MKPVSIAYAKDNLSALLRKVRAGHAITITDRGIPVARLVAPPSAVGVPPRFIEMAQRGIVSLPEREPDASWLKGDLPKLRGARGARDETIVDTLLDERRTGR